MSKNNKDTAFPRPQFGTGGMSLRDYLAAQALVGMGTWSPTFPSLGATIQGNYDVEINKKMAEARAKFAYLQADAMLAERER